MAPDYACTHTLGIQLVGSWLKLKKLNKIVE